tara:strand:+ start:9641 stop:11440 length:1800 start_codon:yes stop_codon:yes gene_type:complete
MSMKNYLLTFSLLLTFLGNAQNILVEKVLYRAPNSINLLSANRSDGHVYFTSADKPGLLYADVRRGEIVLDSTVNAVNCIGYTKYDPVYSLVQLRDGRFYLLNRINGEMKNIANTKLPKLQYDESNELFYGVVDNNVISCKITDDGIASVDTVTSFNGVSLSGVHSFNTDLYYSVKGDDNVTYIAKGVGNKIQKLRYPINYGESSNDIMVLNKDSIIVSRKARLGENQLALIYASEIVRQLDTVQLFKVKEVETTQIDSVISENYISYQEFTTQKQRDIGKGRWSTLIDRTTDALKAMVTLNEALSANPRSFSYKEDSVYFILGPKREVKAEAQKDSVFFSKKGIVTRTYDVVNDTLVKPADVILRLKCIDKLYGTLPGFSVNFYEYETNTLVKSAVAFENEVVYLSYLPEYTLGITITSNGYLPHSMRIDPDLEYKTTAQIEKIVFLDRVQNPHIQGAIANTDLSNPRDKNYAADGITVQENKPSKSTSRPVILKNVFFGFDSDRLSAASMREIKLVYDSQRNVKSMTIIGHTDSKGTASYNQILSEKRASQVGKYLNSLGFSGEIITNGKGETQPIASNETEKGRSQNRRSEIAINY